MANENLPDFQLQSFTIGTKLNFAYQRPNANHQNHKDQYKYKCVDKWHPDLEKAVNDLVKKYAKKLGFPTHNDAWSGIQPRKIQLKGLKVAVEFYIQPSWNEEEQIEITGFYEEGFDEEIRTFVDEAERYIDGRKRKQGDLFARKEAFIEKDMTEVEA